MPGAPEGAFEKAIRDAVRSAVEENARILAASVEKRMLSTTRAMAYLDVGRSTLETLVDEGKLHPVQYREGGAYYYEIKELDRLITSGRTKNHG